MHAFRGVIREMPPDRREVVIKHEAVPGYMAAMTMTFNVRDRNELSGLAVGDQVTFVLTVTPQTHWISNVRKAPGAKRGYSVSPDAPLEAFAAIAPEHPIFRAAAQEPVL